MDRSLDLSLISAALGSHPQLEQWQPDPTVDYTGGVPRGRPDGVATAWEPPLPTARDLQRMLGQAETDLFLNRYQVPPALMRVAWYLHGIASSSPALELYGAERRRRAFQVSAHIFDLASLRASSTESSLPHVFAAQVGYHRSEGEPNAIALSRRVRDRADEGSDFFTRLPTIPLEAGIVFLGLDTGLLRRRLRDWRSEFQQLAQEIGVQELSTTCFGAALLVIDGVAALLRFLTHGSQAALDAARTSLERAVTEPASRDDTQTRWVASHLRLLSDEMEAGSLWRILPPNTPNGARHAFTVASPAVLTLWDPQRALLAPQAEAGAEEELGGLDPRLRRLVISVPTSGGKTLFGELLMTAHIAQEPTAVCYVTPLRSLAREVRRNLRRRLRVLAREVAPEEPDFGVPADSPLAELARTLNINLGQDAPVDDEPDVSVMTPERLAHALREDADGVLARFGLFIFDEAQLVGERGRGFLVESLLAFLHWRTRDTHHRLVLLSAALGNAGHIREWIDVDGASRLVSSKWRGPRRLDAIFNTTIDWNRGPSREEAVSAFGQSAHLVRRLVYDAYGSIRLRPAENQPLSARTTTPLGQTAFRAPADGPRQRSPEGQPHTTPFYVMLAEIVRYVSHGGPVLVIRNTRKDVVQMARAIAADLPASPAARSIAEFARIRLGPDHPLAEVLARSVAYHHAGLPVDIQEAIEEGLRDDALRFVVATSTLTEGVNLPVRTVVLAATPYPGQPEEQQLSGPRLINAIGRAGRATRESEGWVVLARQVRPLSSDFNLLEENDEELAVSSRLSSDAALEALAAFEEAVRDGADAVVSAQDEMADFVSYIWFILAAEEELGRLGDEADPVGAFRATLAYTEMSDDVRARFEAAVELLSTLYGTTDQRQRRRWARTGTTINSARRLDQLASSVAIAVAAMDAAEREQLAAPVATLRLLNDSGAFTAMLSLPERPRDWQFRRTAGATSANVDVDPAEFLEAWLAAKPLPQIADELLSAIPDRALRLERTVDAVSDFCEHYLSWMLGVLTSIINSMLADANIDERLSLDLPVYVRYGVDSKEAVELLLSGIRSRELAARVAAVSDHRAPGQDVRQWLGSMTIPAWTAQFDATPADVLDLLEFSRRRGLGLLRTLLAEGSVEVEIDVAEAAPGTDSLSETPRAVTVSAMPEAAEPPPLGILEFGSADRLGVIPTSAHSEVQAVLNTGLAIEATLLGNMLTLALGEDDRPTEP